MFEPVLSPARRAPRVTLTLIALISISAAAHSANSAPTITGTPATTVRQGTTYSFAPSIYDRDGNRVRCYMANQPSWLSIDSERCRVAGTVPSNVRAGVVYPNLIIAAMDSRGAYSTVGPFSITVAANGSGSGSGSGSLALTGTPSTTVSAGAKYSFTPTLSNTTGKTATFSVANKPSWMSFSTATGSLNGSPSASQVTSYPNITITASNGSTRTALPAFMVTVKPASPASAPSGNLPPAITGKPATVVKAGAGYSFQPTSSDPNGDILTYSISALPSWASFSTTTGVLSGTPSAAQIGSYNNIVISVRDGRGGTASLPGFGILVSAGSVGSATLSWAPPTSTTSGASLSNLAGYRVYYGNSANSLSQTITVSNPGLTSYVVSSLNAGTWYFAVTAYTSTGSESAPSNLGSKTIN